MATQTAAFLTGRWLSLYLDMKLAELQLTAVLKPSSA